MKPTGDDYAPTATCMGCDKSDKECMILQLESYSGAYCMKCAMREARNRYTAKNGKKDQLKENTHASNPV